MEAAFKSFAFERISTEKLKATGWHLSVFFNQYTITASHISFRKAMQMELGFFVKLHEYSQKLVIKSKFKKYNFLHNVRILYYELQNIRVAFFLTGKHAVIPKLGHQHLRANKLGAFSRVNSRRGNSKRYKSCVWTFFQFKMKQLNTNNGNYLFKIIFNRKRITFLRTRIIFL